jgi:hypothetical protein
VLRSTKAYTVVPALKLAPDALPEVAYELVLKNTPFIPVPAVSVTG